MEEEEGRENVVEWVSQCTLCTTPDWRETMIVGGEEEEEEGRKDQVMIGVSNASTDVLAFLTSGAVHNARPLYISLYEIRE